MHRSAPPIVLDDAIVLSHWSGVLVLARSDGHELATYRQAEEEPSFSYRSARLAIDTADAHCAAHGERGFALVCGDRLFFFAGHDVAVFRASGAWPLVARRPLDVTLRTASSSSESFTAKASAENAAITLDADRDF